MENLDQLYRRRIRLELSIAQIEEEDLDASFYRNELEKLEDLIRQKEIQSLK